MAKKPPAYPPVRLVTRAQLCATTSMSASGLRQCLMPQLIKGIHYHEMPGGRKFLYNESLIVDFLVNGNSPAHQRACDAFTRSLPSSQVA